ncbi:conjugative transposon protein TraM [Mucilaginibacter sp.]|uniref:conjugative transposon protein TraM n=1 Tax=Mucilaginibacter sp. TaxID=1882438 RepID=UPI00262C906D|nr:conjugative transposon protein TraM [Mucilaginibacter sp.]MDB4925521.1 Conjugative transposon TraM protein [Mucilaginibacter sp.]
MKEQMEQQQQREKLKKFLLVLPLLVLPFLTMAFWALGGGKGNPNDQTISRKGINTELPEAQFKKGQSQDKLSLYNQAAMDSAKTRNNAANPLFDASKQELTAGPPDSHPADASAARINQKLAQINKEINRPEPAVNPYVTPNPQQNSAEADKLERLMKSMNTKNADNPEMKQLNDMLEKIMDIQHPERISAMPLKGVKTEPDSLYKATRAVIADNQKVLQGTSVKLRLMDSLVIHGQVIPKGQFLFGLCQVTNQRLIINIKTIRLGTSILPVDLSVYDMDAMAGIRAPEAVTEDAVRSGTDNAIQSMQLMSMDQSLATQAAGAGVEAAKTLFSKKVKRIKVKLKAGYPLLLRNNQPDKH